VYEDKKIKKIDTKNYSDLWEVYIDKHSRKRGEK